MALHFLLHLCLDRFMGRAHRTSWRSGLCDLLEHSCSAEQITKLNEPEMLNDTVSVVNFMIMMIMMMMIMMLMLMLMLMMMMMMMTTMMLMLMITLRSCGVMFYHLGLDLFQR